MATLIKKLFLLFSPIALLLLLLLAVTSHSEKWKDGVYDRDLEAKIQALIDNNTEVIVAGDSRAERQVVPAIIHARTGRNAANIATPAGDLITLYNALKEHGLLGKRYVLIVSTSFFQANDGAVDRGYLSPACLMNMTMREKISAFLHARRAFLADLVDMRKALLGDAGGSGPVADVHLETRGFLGVDGTMKRSPSILLNPRTTNHPWYKHVSLHGAKWRIFRETLARFARTGYTIYIYQPPVSPAWYRYTKGSFIDKREREYSEMLREESSRYRNVVFLDFYGEPGDALGDDMYYDIQHLNVAGARVFTARLMDRIGGDLRRRDFGGAARPR
jgi:hypothetical protein